MAKDPKDQSQSNSRVNHPKHYQATITINGKKYPIEPADVIEAFASQDAHKSQAIKYLLRAGSKSDVSYVEDMAKARWWATRAVNFHGGHKEVPKDE